MTKLVQVELRKIIIDENRNDQIIVLKEKDGERQFPIVIGVLEASSIKMKISKVKPPRPMTHDLLVSVLTELDATLERVIVDKMLHNTFHAKLQLKTKSGQKKLVDARPSDSIALAVRTNADIYVDEEILKKAAIFKS